MTTSQILEFEDSKKKPRYCENEALFLLIKKNISLSIKG